jgi:hypothetical protein
LEINDWGNITHDTAMNDNELRNKLYEIIDGTIRPVVTITDYGTGANGNYIRRYPQATTTVDFGTDGLPDIEELFEPLNPAQKLGRKGGQSGIGKSKSRGNSDYYSNLSKKRKPAKI